MAALYKRVVLKLSGEALKGSAASGIDFSVLQFISREVQQLSLIHISEPTRPY